MAFLKYIGQYKKQEKSDSPPKVIQPVASKPIDVDALGFETESVPPNFSPPPTSDQDKKPAAIPSPTKPPAPQQIDSEAQQKKSDKTEENGSGNSSEGSGSGSGSESASEDPNDHELDEDMVPEDTLDEQNED